MKIRLKGPVNLATTANATNVEISTTLVVPIVPPIYSIRRESMAVVCVQLAISRAIPVVGYVQTPILAASIAVMTMETQAAYHMTLHFLSAMNATTQLSTFLMDRYVSCAR